MPWLGPLRRASSSLVIGKLLKIIRQGFSAPSREPFITINKPFLINSLPGRSPKSSVDDSEMTQESPLVH